MLENSVWGQYLPERSVGEALAALCGCEVSDFNGDDGRLYAELKQTLTKKELRLFAMCEAGMEDAAMMESFGFDADSLRKSRKKTYHKVREKVCLRLRAASEV